MARMGDSSIRVFRAKSSKKESLGRRRARWENNINFFLKRREWKEVDEICIAQDTANDELLCTW